MKKIKDLNLEKDILPLFDSTLNMFSKNKVLEILSNPLLDKQEIYFRQTILKGFLGNSTIDNYFYHKSYLSTTYDLMNNYDFEDFINKKWKYKFLTSKLIKTEHQSKLTQLVLLFSKLYTDYFSKINLKVFPELYKNKIKGIYNFLLEFKLEEYENSVAESKLNDKNILDLFKKITELKDSGRIDTFWENLFEFEAYFSIANGIRHENFTFPSISEKKIALEKFYHPVIKNPILNDFETSRNVILINGANMSGKSTFLRAISLCSYLAHLGIAVPAKKAEIPLTSKFSISITRSDDLSKGYSHFMSEIISLKEVVEQALNGESCFAVFDELFSSTNVEDAYEICKTTITGLSKFENSFFFISTHNQSLVEIQNSKVASYYLDTELNNEKPKFTYELKSGWTDIKVGQILFQNEGLNKMLGN